MQGGVWILLLEISEFGFYFLCPQRGRVDLGRVSRGGEERESPPKLGLGTIDITPLLKD